MNSFFFSQSGWFFLERGLCRLGSLGFVVHSFVYNSGSVTNFYLHEPMDLMFRPPLRNLCFKEGRDYKNGPHGSPSSLSLSVFLSSPVSPPFLYLTLCLWKSKLSRISMDRYRFIEVEIREASCSRDIITRFRAVICYWFLYQINFKLISV